MPWMLFAFGATVFFFHLSEVLLVVRYHRDRLSWESALLSPAYVAMLVLALVEFELERRYAPWLKVDAVAAVGLALVIAGEVTRKTAMMTAAKAFTHNIAEVKLAEHRLVTRGIYRWVRHPGYLGWFWWAIGAQLVLVNPVTTALATIAAWRFFARRIPHEEALLTSFFGADYDAYKRRTRTFLPFIP